MTYEQQKNALKAAGTANQCVMQWMCYMHDPLSVVIVAHSKPIIQLAH